MMPYSTNPNYPYPPNARNGGIGLAIGASVVTAVIGSAVWGLIAYVTHYQFSILAIALGVAVGAVLRKVSGGLRSQALGVAGAVIATLGCALGNLVAEVLVLLAHHIPLGVMLANFGTIMRLYPDTIGLLGYLFWALAAFYGYRVAMGAGSFRGRRRGPAHPEPAFPPPYGQAPGTPYGQAPGTPYGSAQPETAPFGPVQPGATPADQLPTDPGQPGQYPGRPENPI